MSSDRGEPPDADAERLQAAKIASPWAALAESVAVAVWGAGALAADLSDTAGWYRAPLVAVFVLVVPGLAIIRLTRIPGLVFQLALGIALSVSFAVLISISMIYAHAWSPSVALAILVGVAVAATALNLMIALIRSARDYAGSSDVATSVSPAPWAEGDLPIEDRK